MLKRYLNRKEADMYNNGFKNGGFTVRSVVYDI